MILRIGVKLQDKTKISFKISKEFEYDDYVCYRASCLCGDDRCSQDLSLEIIDFENIKFRQLELCISGKVWFNGYHYSSKWITEKWNSLRLRVTTAFKAIVFGYFSFNSNFIFHNEEAIRGYIAALEEGLLLIKGVKKDGKSD